MMTVYFLYYLEQCLCLVKLANRGQSGPSKCAAGSLDNRFFLSTLLVNSNQGWVITKPPVLHWLCVYWPDPILTVRLLWMDQFEIMLSMQSVEERTCFQFFVSQNYTVKIASVLDRYFSMNSIFRKKGIVNVK